MRMIALRAGRALIEGCEQRGWWVHVAEGVITSVAPQPQPQAQQLDLGEGVDLIPGIIDLHSDCLEELAHPRPSAEIPLAAAIVEYDTLLVTHGITTSYLCINLDDDARKWRTAERARETESTLRRIRHELRVDHRIHLRVDVTSTADALMNELCDGGLVAMLSYMDHTPGQGQFSTLEEWRAIYGRGLDDEALERALEQKRAGVHRAAAMRRSVATTAQRIGATLASHDDDGRAAVLLAADLGVQISEFPVNEEAAKAARGIGMGIVMGAPNARRGGSHVPKTGGGANLSAREALRANLLDAVCSDYHPPSLLAAAYVLAAESIVPWQSAVRIISEGPARIAGLHDRGRIAPGMRADLVAVTQRASTPIVQQTWIAGAPALGVARGEIAVAAAE
jgi:alpha-D-ribose 1-methylphosphonate 5-triphosphate diphosphatase